MQPIGFAISTLVLLSLQAGAQEPVDLDGVWRMDPSRSESAHQAAPIGPVTLIISHTGGELSIETRRGEKHKPAVSSETLVYRLDGSENSFKGSSGVEIKTKARWDGTKLIAETVRNIQGSTVTTMHVFNLAASGKELTIHMTLTIQHGYQFPGATNTGTGKDVFIRSKAPIRK